jgi:hypothetical protein
MFNKSSFTTFIAIMKSDSMEFMKQLCDKGVEVVSTMEALVNPQVFMDVEQNDGEGADAVIQQQPKTDGDGAEIDRKNIGEDDGVEIVSQKIGEDVGAEIVSEKNTDGGDGGVEAVEKLAMGAVVVKPSVFMDLEQQPRINDEENGSWIVNMVFQIVDRNFFHDGMHEQVSTSALVTVEPVVPLAVDNVLAPLDDFWNNAYQKNETMPAGNHAGQLFAMHRVASMTSHTLANEKAMALVMAFPTVDNVEALPVFIVFLFVYVKLLSKRFWCVDNSEDDEAVFHDALEVALEEGTDGDDDDAFYDALEAAGMEADDVLGYPIVNAEVEVVGNDNEEVADNLENDDATLNAPGPADLEVDEADLEAPAPADLEVHEADLEAPAPADLEVHEADLGAPAPVDDLEVGEGVDVPALADLEIREGLEELQLADDGMIAHAAAELDAVDEGVEDVAEVVIDPPRRTVKFADNLVQGEQDAADVYNLQEYRHYNQLHVKQYTAEEKAGFHRDEDNVDHLWQGVKSMRFQAYFVAMQAFRRKFAPSLLLTNPGYINNDTERGDNSVFWKANLLYELRQRALADYDVEVSALEWRKVGDHWILHEQVEVPELVREEDVVIANANEQVDIPEPVQEEDAVIDNVDEQVNVPQPVQEEDAVMDNVDEQVDVPELVREVRAFERVDVPELVREEGAVIDYDNRELDALRVAAEEEVVENGNEIDIGNDNMAIEAPPVPAEEDVVENGNENAAENVAAGVVVRRRSRRLAEKRKKKEAAIAAVAPRRSARLKAKEKTNIAKATNAAKAAKSKKKKKKKVIGEMAMNGRK